MIYTLGMPRFRHGLARGVVPSAFADDHADDARVLVELFAGADAELSVDVADVDVDGIGRAFQVLGNAVLGEALEQQGADASLGRA